MKQQDRHIQFPGSAGGGKTNTMNPKKINSGVVVMDLRDEPVEDRVKRNPNAIDVSEYRGMVVLTFGRDFQAIVTPDVSRELVKRMRKVGPKAERSRLKEKATIQARSEAARQKAKAERAAVLKRQEELQKSQESKD